MIRIKIEEKNIADIWSLTCVRWIEKMGEGRVVVGISYKKEKPRYYMYAYIGDTIEVERAQSEIGRVISYEP